MIAYRVRDYKQNFEKADMRKCAHARWVAVPNRMDGKGFRRVANHDHNVSLFAAWVLIVEVASKMPERGLLVDEDGPLDADDLAVMTGFPAEIFAMAFVALCDKRIGWLERVSGEFPGSARAPSGEHPDTVRGLPDYIT